MGELVRRVVVEKHYPNLAAYFAATLMCEKLRITDIIAYEIVTLVEKISPILSGLEITKGKELVVTFTNPYSIDQCSIDLSEDLVISLLDTQIDISLSLNNLERSCIVPLGDLPIGDLPANGFRRFAYQAIWLEFNCGSKSSNSIIDSKLIL